ncbi:MAG: molybdopterin-synthase adenylyltransferase MoeB [Azospirillaceae bacterium]
MSQAQARLDALRRAIEEIEPAEAARRARQGAILVDIRDEEEVRQGSPKGALRIPKSFLELQIEKHVADPEAPVMLMCAGGTRSLFAADALRTLGFETVASVTGGYNRWKEEGLDTEVPRLLTPAQMERYRRHLSLPEVGIEGQQKLLDARVLVIGAGGLGSPTLLYLAAAGVGTIGIVDNDVVEPSNLQRQVLHSEETVGMAKTASAARALKALNADVEVVEVRERLTADNVNRVFEGYDVVVDGTDNFQTRYLVNEACVALGIPNVYSAILQFEAQLSVFWPAKYPETPCYSCLYPVVPPAALAPSCGEAGVLGVLPGTMGLLQATEAIKAILGAGTSLVGRLLTYDALAAEFGEYEIDRAEDCPVCGAAARDTAGAEAGAATTDASAA